ncbi:MAG TPA: methylmalonyl-CoA mutase family protein [Bacteroidales bacterium]|nr:hypothetical protein [Bacteroidales bacterium]HNR42715.1 methylmalonyl-CoA mutase family protein [Bacteroidales bacterium]HPM17545.1 methylmalonyl-CoA mutase family protein [Bacteroidales bacterium]HQG76955.1 methylmalonyl-CoA mutase family protein [Bacteroidales bacterium]
MKQKKLFEEFPATSTGEWLDRIRAELKGADLNEKLLWKTGEGFDLMPFYRREDMEKLRYTDAFMPLYLGKDGLKCRNSKEDPGQLGKSKGDKAASWLVRQDVLVQSYASANEQALSLLERGVDSLGFLIGDPDTISNENFAMLLRDFNPSCAEINFSSEGKAIEIVSLVSDLLADKEPGRKSVRGAVEADPLVRLMIQGKLCIPVDAGLDYLAALVRKAMDLPYYRSIHIHGTYFRKAGSGPVLELALAIAMAVEYIDQLTSRGIDPGTAASAIRFSFGIGPSYFMEIGRLRAARLLWEVVCRKFGVTDDFPARMEIHSETVLNAAAGDPFLNMIGSQAAAMSAIIGGTDSLTVHPVEYRNGMTGDFPERIARNQQLLLKEEAFFDRVADPSAGSYYIETITSHIAENAWNIFLQIEKKGGFLQALNSGMIHTLLHDRKDHGEKAGDRKGENYKLS